MGVDIQTYRAKIGTFRHSCGVDVVTLVLVVNFSDGLKAIGSVLFIGLLLMMAGIEPNPGPRGSENADRLDVMKPTKIRVTDLPESISKEVMELYFEHKSGSEVKDVTINKEGRCAIIEFLDANAVEAVMLQLPLCLSGTTVSIDIYDESAVQDDAPINSARLSLDHIQPKKIKVMGLPKEATEEILIMFFENEKRQGGGKVKVATVNADQNYAVIEFEEAAAVDRVMQKQPIVIFNTTVKVEVDADETPKKNMKPTKLKVSGLPESATDEILIMFFENEKRQGGGNVRSVKMSAEKHSAIVEFEESSEASKAYHAFPVESL